MNCIIVHGCADDKNDKTYDGHWIPWVKKELVSEGIEVETPLMPEPWHPDYARFKEVFETCEIHEGSVLVGHSCGCAFLVRWLGETKKNVRKLILVAPWKTTEDPRDLRRKEFYDYDIHSDVKSFVEKVVIFTSNDEGAGGKKSARIFHDALGGEIIELKDHGHYTLDDMGTEEFPELVREILG